jgi:hypothetical protein
MPAHQSLKSLVTVTADATSPGSATYQVTTGVGGFAEYKAITILATVQGATGGTLDIVIESSPDDGVSWYEYWRLPTLQAAAAAVTYRYGPALNDSPTLVGKNDLTGSTLTTTFVLGAGSVSGSHWFDKLRVRYVAGANTTLGAAQDIKVLCIDDSE